MHAEARKDHQMLYSITFLHNPLRQGFSLNLELTISASLADQEAPWLSCLPPLPALGL